MGGEEVGRIPDGPHDPGLPLLHVQLRGDIHLIVEIHHRCQHRLRGGTGILDEDRIATETETGTGTETGMVVTGGIGTKKETMILGSGAAMRTVTAAVTRIVIVGEAGTVNANGVGEGMEDHLNDKNLLMKRRLSRGLACRDLISQH